MSFTKTKVSNLAVERKLRKARHMLELPAECTQDDVRTQFAAKVKAMHPDAGNQGEAIMQSVQIKDLRAAKETLLAHMRDVSNE